MSLRIRRGTNADRLLITPDDGELIYVNGTGPNARKLYIGDGTTVGGRNIGEALAGNNLVWDNISQTLQSTASGGSTLPPNALGFLRNDGAGSLSWTTTTTSSVAADTNPSLGGNLTLSGYNIAGTGNISITGNITIGVSNTITAQKISAGIEGLAISSSNTVPLTVTGIITGGANGQLFVSIRASKGTTASPTTTVAGDNLGGVVIAGYNGTAYQGSAIISSAWEAGAVLSETLPKSTITLGVAGGGTTLRRATFNSSGVFNAPLLNTTTYSAAGTAIPSAATSGVGARAFVTDATVGTFGTAYTSGGSNSVPVYSNGTSWYIG